MKLKNNQGSINFGSLAPGREFLRIEADGSTWVRNAEGQMVPLDPQAARWLTARLIVATADKEQDK